MRVFRICNEWPELPSFVVGAQNPESPTTPHNLRCINIYIYQGVLGSLGIWTVSLCGETFSARKTGPGSIFELVAFELLLGFRV